MCHSDSSSFEDLDFTISQRTLSRFIDQYSFDSLSTSAPDNRAKALILAMSAPHAGDCLRAIPSPTLGLHFHDVEFRFGLLYWLGIPMTDSSLFCSVCDKGSDSMGDHAVGCGGNGDRISRHDAIREILFSSTQSAGLAPRREVPSIIPYSSSRPADIYLPFWSGGRPAAVDVTVISPFQKSTITASSSSQGAALTVAETRKNAAHLSNCRSTGVSFLPLAVETLGCWSRDAVSTIRSIGRLQALRLGLDPGETISHLFQRLSGVVMPKCGAPDSPSPRHQWMGS